MNIELSGFFQFIFIWKVSNNLHLLENYNSNVINFKWLLNIYSCRFAGKTLSFSILAKRWKQNVIISFTVMSKKIPYFLDEFIPSISFIMFWMSVILFLIIQINLILDLTIAKFMFSNTITIHRTSNSQILLVWKICLLVTLTKPSLSVWLDILIDRFCFFCVFYIFVKIYHLLVCVSFDKPMFMVHIDFISRRRFSSLLNCLGTVHGFFDRSFDLCQMLLMYRCQVVSIGRLVIVNEYGSV